MNKRYRLIFIAVLLCLLWAFVYWISYKYTYKSMENNKLYDESQLIGKSLFDRERENKRKFSAITEALASGNTKRLRVKADTVCIIEQYDETAGTFTVRVLPVPIELLGNAVAAGDTIAGTPEKIVLFFDGRLLVIREHTE